MNDWNQTSQSNPASGSTDSDLEKLLGDDQAPKGTANNQSAADDSAKKVDETSSSEPENGTDSNEKLTPVEPTYSRRGDYNTGDLELIWNFGVAFQGASQEYRDLFHSSMGVSGNVIDTAVGLVEPNYRTSSVEGILSLVKDADIEADVDITDTIALGKKLQEGKITFEEFTAAVNQSNSIVESKAELAKMESEEMRALVKFYNFIASEYIDGYTSIRYRINLDHDDLVQTLEKSVNQLPKKAVEFLKWSKDMLEAWPNSRV